jgi:hypothetical protein
MAWDYTARSRQGLAGGLKIRPTRALHLLPYLNLGIGTTVPQSDIFQQSCFVIKIDDVTRRYDSFFLSTHHSST